MGGLDRSFVASKMAVFAVAGIALASGSAAAAPVGGARPVVIVASASGNDTVEFSFPDSIAPAAARIDALSVMMSAGLAPRGVSVRTDGHERLVDVKAHLSTGDGFLRRHLDGAVLGRLETAAGASVALQLPADSQPVGVRLDRSSSGITARYRLPAAVGISYRVLPSAVAGYLLLLALAVLLPVLGLRRVADRIERRADDRVAAVQRLRAISMSALFGGLLLLPVVVISGWAAVPGQFLGHAAPGLMAGRVVNVVAAYLGVLAPYVLLCIGTGRAVRPAYARLRGIKLRRTASKKAAPLIVLVPMMVYFVALAAVHGAGSGFVPLIYVVLMLFLGPLLMLRAMRTRPASEPLASRISELLGGHGVKVRGIRIMPARDEKVANALVVGLVPQVRYVIVSDFLLDNFDDEEVDAVIAHEAGHLRHHHLLIKMLAILFGVASGAAVGGAIAALADLSPSVIAVGAMVGLPLSVVLVPGLIGIRLEERADDFAARAVGPEPLRRALEHLAQLNMTPRRTRLMWNMLTQHPGLDQRVRRLDASSPRAGRRATAA